MSVIGSNILAGASGQGGDYTIARSLRFRSSASAYLNRTPASAGNRKTWTWSGWVKRGELGSQTLFGASDGVNTDGLIRFLADGLQFIFSDYRVNSIRSSAVYRDPSAWYHIVVAVDSTQATASNRVKMYVNNVLITSFLSEDYPTQNLDGRINNNILHTIGKDPTSSALYFDGYMTEVNFIDGQQLTPSSFGSTNASTGVWQPKKYAGTYGTNGFYLPFSDNASTTTLGSDFSGNGNNWTTNNISLTAGSTYDSMTDVPTLTSETAANFAVWNPLFSPANKTISNGNLSLSIPTTVSPTLSTIGVKSGKWYAEFQSNTTNCNVGLANTNLSLASYIGSDANGFGLLSGNGQIYYNGSGTSYGSSYTSSDTMMIAFDLDNGKIWWGKNGTWFNSGNPATGTNAGVAASGGTVTASIDTTKEWFIASGTTVYPNGADLNCGQRPFTYTPPTGFVALNTFNLPTPTIGATASTQAGKYFNTVLYTGNGSTQSITGVGFQPDFVWGKSRTAAEFHSLQDVVRGTNSLLHTNTTGAEIASGSNALTSFNSDGFSVGSWNEFNQSGQSYVAWNWRASNATAVTNTAGSITSTVSANTSAGFSVVTYTGTGSNATVGHGLGVAPSMVIVKRRSASGDDWICYNANLGNTKFIRLNTTGIASTFNLWQNTTPTSTVFSLATDVAVNGSGSTYVAYCFSEVAGYSKAFSYTGNGSTDGVFTYLGFKPKFIMIKQSSASGENWEMWDSVRGSYNINTPLLYANLSNAETAGTAARFDALSNGFKIRSTNGGVNTSGATYIGLAFAEFPTKYALGV
jgi:hypothetical protein